MYDKTITTGNNPANGYEQALTEVWRLIKFHNATSLLNVSADDIKYLAQNLQKEYSVHLVQRARDMIKVSHSGKNLTLGVFLEKCAELKRADTTYAETAALTEAPKDKKFGIEKENFTKIKELLASAIKPLPYNKDFRVTGNGDSEGSPDTPRVEKLSVFPVTAMEYIKPTAEVKNPELRALYAKAWSDKGLLSEEKKRFDELLEQEEPKKQKYRK